MKKTWVVASVILFIALVAAFISCSDSSGSSSSRSSGSRSSSHTCYVCGKSASEKVGSYWYCSTHAAWVKALSD